MNMIRDPHRKPTHPGEVLREDVLPALGMTQGALADRLGVGRVTVSELLLEKRALSTEMALLLAKLLRAKPDVWLRMQLAYDLWEAERKSAEKIAAVKALPASAIRGLDAAS